MMLRWRSIALDQEHHFSSKKTTMLQGQANFLDFTFFSAKNDIY